MREKSVILSEVQPTSHLQENTPHEGEVVPSDSAVDWGEWSASRPGRFALDERTLVHIGKGTGWVPEPVWTVWRKNILHFWDSIPGL
jgi:hypothetical protein